MDEVRCLDEADSVFHSKLGKSTLVVKQPKITDLPDIREGLKLASYSTFLRHPSWMWRHPQGVCHLPRHQKGEVGMLFLIVKLDEKVVGFSHHNYWNLTEKMQEQENFPPAVGSLCVDEKLCIFDAYHKQGIEAAYIKVGTHIAKHNGANLLLGDTFKEGIMLDIWLNNGWTNYGNRKAEDGSIRIMMGRTLE